MSTLTIDDSILKLEKLYRTNDTDIPFTVLARCIVEGNRLGFKLILNPNTIFYGLTIDSVIKQAFENIEPSVQYFWWSINREPTEEELWEWAEIQNIITIQDIRIENGTVHIYPCLPFDEVSYLYNSLKVDYQLWFDGK